MDKGHGNCDFSLMALDVPPPKGPLFIFGDPFLRRFVTIYDKNGPRVGFAVAKHGGMDSMMANQIISNVGGQAQDGQSSSAAQYSYDPKQVTMNLDSGMMMGDPASSEDDSPTPDRATTVAEARADVAANDAASDATSTPASTPASLDYSASSSGSDDIIKQFASGWEKTSADITAPLTATSTTAAPSSDPLAASSNDQFKFAWDSSSPASTTTTEAANPFKFSSDDKFQFSWDKPSSDSTKASTPASSDPFKFSWDKPSSTDSNAPVDYVKKYGLGSESAPSDSSSSATPHADGVLAEMNKLLGKTESPLETSPAGMWIQAHAQGFKGRHGGQHHANRLVSVRLYKSDKKLNREF